MMHQIIGPMDSIDIAVYSEQSMSSTLWILVGLTSSSPQIENKNSKLRFNSLLRAGKRFFAFHKLAAQPSVRIKEKSFRLENGMENGTKTKKAMTVERLD